MSDNARPLILVNSGAYSPQELAAEFGELPPALLPVGLQRLYEHQAAMFAGVDADLFLTLPESFDIPALELEKIQAAGFEVILTPDDLSLGAALLFALAKVGMADRSLKILHGDTLLHGIDVEKTDLVAVAPGRDGYRWGIATTSEDGRLETVAEAQRATGLDGLRLCGYFAFSSSRAFAERLILAQGNFIDAVNAHAAASYLATVTPADWFDFGHVQTYFRSRRIVTTARTFNSLTFENLYVRKRSASSPHKIRAEAHWLSNIPPAMAPFCARVLSQGEDKEGYYYDTEYRHLPSLSELCVFGRLSLPVWNRILESCSAFIASSVDSARGVPGERALVGLAIDKTCERLTTYARTEGVELHAPLILNGAPAPSLRACLDGVSSIIAASEDDVSIMHGDFCFSNILYSFRTDRICLLDPRGLTERGDFTLYGDVKYDLAKLMHSISGRYDLIMAGHAKGRRVGACEYELNFSVDPWRRDLERLAGGLTMGGIKLDSQTIAAVVISLFLSMAPLHADRPDRQAIFIANALRLYIDLEGAAR